MTDLPPPQIRISTPRTILRLGASGDVPAIVRYQRENRERFRAYDPERPPLFFEERFWRMQIRQNEDDLAADRALRLFIFLTETPDQVVGTIGFSNFVRGVGQYCTLGYALAGHVEGRGLMQEALGAAIRYTFGSLNFHRIEANYMPHNVRSGKLLRRLGFVVEGYSRDYLKIDGVWQDHVRTALLNPDWTEAKRPQRSPDSP